jgi:Clp amino terminal domain, pathogenicity island component
MPEPITIASAVAGRLATILSGPLKTKIEAEVLGPAERRAVENACRDAIEEVVRSLAADADEAEVVHVLQLLNDALAARGTLDLPLVETLTGAGATATWHRTLDQLGYDAETLPVALDAFVEELLKVLPRTLRSQAGRHGSPLFQGIALADLEWLRRDAGEVRAAITRRVVAPALPLSAELEAALDASYAGCRATNTRFYTPNLLLALLDSRDGVARACFNRVESGLSGEVRARLAGYVANPGAGQGFVAFRWPEREDVRTAQLLAAEAGSPVITPACLLAAVLETPSSTREQLLAFLGTERFERLRAHTLTARTLAAPAVTPGTVFGEGP